MPYRIVLQSSQSKNIFLETPEQIGYTDTNETKQKAVGHAQALEEAIVGPKHDIQSYDLASARYIVVTVPGHSGQIRSD